MNGERPPPERFGSLGHKAMIETHKHGLDRPTRLLTHEGVRKYAVNSSYQSWFERVGGPTLTFLLLRCHTPVGGGERAATAKPLAGTRYGVT